MSHEFDAEPSAQPPAVPARVETEVSEQVPKTVLEVFAEITAALGPRPPGAEEYLCVPNSSIDGDREWPRGLIAAFVVTGGSEGHYVHVEVIDGDRCDGVLLGKTFKGKDAAWALARRLADLLGA